MKYQPVIPHTIDVQQQIPSVNHTTNVKKKQNAKEDRKKQRKKLMHDMIDFF